MALTPTQEAQVLQLVAEQAALLSLADNEATIISKLGATKVNLSSLGSAVTFDDADIMLIRQGTTDLSIAGSVVKAAVAVPDASETVKGKVELATSAETIAGADNTRAVHPAGATATFAKINGNSTQQFSAANAASAQQVTTFAQSLAGATIQDVTASRALSTFYTNSTPRAIFVLVDILTAGTSQMTAGAEVNGISFNGSSFSGSAGIVCFVAFIVPPGGTYSAVNVTSGGTLSKWIEVR